MAALFVVPRSERRTFLDRTCSLDNCTDQQLVNRNRLDRGSILDIEREYVTPKFATKTIDERDAAWTSWTLKTTAVGNKPPLD